MGLKLLLVAVLAFTSITTIVLFGDSPSLRGSAVARARLRLIQILLQGVTAYERLNNRTNGRLGWSLGYVVPAFYLGLISICLHLFFTVSYPELPSHITNSTLHLIAIHVSIATVYFSFAILTFSDPGYIVLERTASRAQELQPYNNIIFFLGKECYTCRYPKPARLKHCLVCDRCVALYDHHCVWVNNCIGFYNYRWFLAFLFANIVFLSYGFYICFSALQQQTAYGNWWRRIAYSNEANKTTGVFLIFCAIFLPVVTIFTGFQIRYIYLGVTTNECEKWSEIEYLIDVGSLYEVEEQDILSEPYLERVLVPQVYISLNDERVMNRDGHGLRLVESVAEIDNQYDHGFWGNIRERVIDIEDLGG